jgi:hypothetical protein
MDHQSEELCLEWGRQTINVENLTIQCLLIHLLTLTSHEPDLQSQGAIRGIHHFDCVNDKSYVT